MSQQVTGKLDSDCISRQAAIDALLRNQEVYSNNFGNDPIDKYTIAIIDNDAQTIAQLPSAQPEQQWIPVTERLPKENKPVLVTHYGKYQAFVSVDWIDPYTSEWNRTCNVTAWQPLPKPWKGGDEC